MLVRARTGAFVPAATAVRTGLALAACLGLGLVMPHVGRLVAPLLAFAVGAAYVAFLVVTREIGAADLAIVRALASKRK
jgi:hypothetical protein